MYSELEKIDILRHRVAISYEEAQESLQTFEGDLIKTLVYLEKGRKPVVSVREQVLGEIKGLLEAGKIRRVRVLQGGKVYLDIPVGVGAAGLLGMAFSTPLMVMGALVTAVAWTKDFRVEVTKQGGHRYTHQYRAIGEATCKRGDYFTQGLMDDLLAKDGFK